MVPQFKAPGSTFLEARAAIILIRLERELTDLRRPGS
jgi:hypothetical protein